MIDHGTLIICLDFELHWEFGQEIHRAIPGQSLRGTRGGASDVGFIHFFSVTPPESTNLGNCWISCFLRSKQELLGSLPVEKPSYQTNP